ncbi:PEP-utilizing enzyme [Streptomyces sp. NPDC015125]|uniref:PEP-utilizing enzyme n=1 Tax=Streptomyces sp. NPDC015125 TaxID=3364938 RepID=UPI003702EC9C
MTSALPQLGRAATLGEFCLDWADDLIPPATHPRRRAAVLEHARDQLSRLGLPAGASVTLYRHAFFRLPHPTPPADDAACVEVFGNGILLARAVCAEGAGCPVRIEVTDWTDDDGRDTRARFLLGTKAQTLGRLVDKLTSGHTLPQLTVTDVRWRWAKPEVVEEIATQFAGVPLIVVRSSAASEDTWLESKAGAYESVIGIDPRDREAVEAACTRVWSSYLQPGPGDEILIQPALTSVQAAGVITTRELLTKAPYYVIECDDSSGRTDTVTGGSGNSRTFYVARDAPAVTDLPAWVTSATSLARELEELIGCDELDIEFALTAEYDGIVLLQVRRLGGRSPHEAMPDTSYAIGVHTAKRGMAGVRAARTLGAGVQLSGMSDWNPAEMIGFRPKPLARSLYEYLITDEVWAQSRRRLGYRDLRGVPLMVDVAGYAFVDVRASLSSFIPATVDDALAERLVRHYTDTLRRAPHLHDKIEFDIAATCLDFRWSENAARLGAAGFTADQVEALRRGLLSVTLRALDIPQQAATYFERSARIDSDVPDLATAERKLAFIRCDGTPTFADAARAGFVAMSFVRTLVDVGLSTSDHLDTFMTSLHTVSNELVSDGQQVAAGRLPWSEFLSRYRHLRPGTYDIESPTYGSDPDSFLAHFAQPRPHAAVASTLPWPTASTGQVSDALRSLGVDLPAVELARFISAAIELRERVKFDFTRHLSDALETIAGHYEALGVSRAELAYLRIGDLWVPPGEWAADVGQLRAVAAARRRAFEHSAHVRLPEYCDGPDRLRWFEVGPAAPNFIGHGRVRAPITVIDGSVTDPSGSVVVIEAADPGHDWIFGYPIAGLVTRYGGANSHMAIRAAELSVPAAIGVGEKLFHSIVRETAIDLDCGARRVMPL